MLMSTLPFVSCGNSDGYWGHFQSTQETSGDVTWGESFEKENWEGDWMGCGAKGASFPEEPQAGTWHRFSCMKEIMEMVFMRDWTGQGAEMWKGACDGARKSGMGWWKISSCTKPGGHRMKLLGAKRARGGPCLCAGDKIPVKECLNRPGLK